MRSLLLISFAVSLAFGVVVGAGAMYIAWQHNLQCEFHCIEEGIHYNALFAVGLSWAGVVTMAGFVFGGLLPATIRLHIALFSGRCAQQALQGPTFPPSARKLGARCHMCKCATLPKVIYLKSKPDGFESTLVEIPAGNWVKLFRCTECKQLWRIDQWDKYQTQFAAKVPSIEGWESFDTSPFQKQLLLQSRGGLSNDICNWASCGKPAVKGMAMCIDHLFETGARE